MDYCYYRGPHSGGAVFAAFSGVPAEVFAPVDAAKFTTLAMQCIQQYKINHKIFIESFLIWIGIKYEWKENKIAAHFKQELEIEFEPVGDFWRIKSMKIH